MSTTPKGTTPPAWHQTVAIRRFHRMIESMTEAEKEQLHPSYQRLMEAAAILRGVHGEAALTEILRSNDQQKVNNWQRRGVSKEGALDAERHIGCPAIWILDGTIPPCEEWTKLQQQRAEQKDGAYESAELRELHALAMGMDAESIRALILLLKKL